ncbi:MAG: hypothetical protein NTX96_02320 [Candidatus Zambryskibacteria bacterium]|nr:hypothetical protein [Candidatus Zambryskibacteria bacterium]
MTSITTRLLSFPKKRKYKPWRILWSADFIARENYTCDMCHCEIYGGDTYTRTVFRCNTIHLYIERVHSYPECPVDPWEEERKIHEEMDREESREREEPKDKSEAA